VEAGLRIAPCGPFRYIVVLVPDHADQVKRVLDIPHKRFDRRIVDFLSRAEFEALLAAPDRKTWIGRRDHALLLVAIQTGLRASELANLRIDQIVPGKHAHIRCTGKGSQGALHPTHRSDDRGPASLAPGAPWCSARSCLPIAA
jgi:integrase